jgi:hypothetical protein
VASKNRGPPLDTSWTDKYQPSLAANRLSGESGGSSEQETSRTSQRDGRPHFYKYLITIVNALCPFGAAASFEDAQSLHLRKWLQP